MNEPNKPVPRSADWLEDDADEIPNWAELPRLEIGDQASASMVIRFPLVPAVPAEPSPPAAPEPPDLLPPPPGMIVVNDDFAGLRRLRNSFNGPKDTPKPVELSSPANGVAEPEAPTTEAPPPPVAKAPAALVVVPEPPAPGQPIVYGIVLRNTSAETMHDVRIEHDLPPGPRYLASDPPAKLQGRRLVWDLGTVEPGAKQRFKITIQPNRPDEVPEDTVGLFEVHQCLRSKRRLLRPAVTATLRLPERAGAGESVSLTVEVHNNGRGPADDLRVLAPLPPGLTHADGAIIQFARPRLGPGEPELFVTEIQVERGGEYTIPAHVFGNNKLLVSTQATLSVDGPAEPPAAKPTLEPPVAVPRAAAESQPAAAGPQPFVVFNLAGEYFALPAGRVREVRRAQAATPRPQGPEWLAGTVDAGGVSMPLVDLRCRLGLATDGPAARFLVVGDGSPVALLVDRALGVRRLDAVPAGGAGLFASASAEHEGRRVTILDLDRLLQAPELRK
jgi:chemotaxis signal transduction protein